MSLASRWARVFLPWLSMCLVRWVSVYLIVVVVVVIRFLTCVCLHRSFIIVHVNNKFVLLLLLLCFDRETERGETRIRRQTNNNSQVLTRERRQARCDFCSSWFQSMENDPHSRFDVFIYDVYFLSLAQVSFVQSWLLIVICSHLVGCGVDSPSSSYFVCISLYV